MPRKPRPTTGDPERRAELADFLRTRRQRLTPMSVGLPLLGRRRAPGLRREEVALLAGMGATWYTWLEQGRDIRVSPDALGRLADGLRLRPEERVHLYTLAGVDLPGQAEAARADPEAVELLDELLEPLNPNPSFVADTAWDVVAANAAARAFFPNFQPARGPARPASRADGEGPSGGVSPTPALNVLRYAFTDLEWRRGLRNWEAQARMALAAYREGVARVVDDPRVTTLVADLSRESAEFRAWWSRHDLWGGAPFSPHVPHVYDHPQLGTVRVRSWKSRLVGSPNLILAVHVPCDAASAERLAQLTKGPRVQSGGCLPIERPAPVR